MKKIVKMDVFVIPNESFKISEDDLRIMNTILIRAEKLLGVEIKRGDRVKQFWMTDPEGEVQNFNSEWYGFQKKLGIPEPEENQDRNLVEEFQIGFFPEYLPVKLFDGKKEGDVVKFHCPYYDVEIEMTLKQNNYRYRMFGPFEKALQG